MWAPRYPTLNPDRLRSARSVLDVDFLFSVESPEFPSSRQAVIRSRIVPRWLSREDSRKQIPPLRKSYLSSFAHSISSIVLGSRRITTAIARSDLYIRSTCFLIIRRIRSLNCRCSRRCDILTKTWRGYWTSYMRELSPPRRMWALNWLFLQIEVWKQEMSFCFATNTAKSTKWLAQSFSTTCKI